MPRPAGHMKPTGSSRQVVEARLWTVYSAAVRLVGSAKMVGRTPTGAKPLFATDPGAMLALACRCDELGATLARLEQKPSKSGVKA